MRNYILGLEAERNIERSVNNVDEIYADDGFNTSSRQLTTLLGKRINPLPLIKELSRPVFTSPTSANFM